MIDLLKRISAFSTLGEFLLQFDTDRNKNPEFNEINEIYYEEVENAIISAARYNGWFTEQNVRRALVTWGQSLEENKLLQWVSPYRQQLESTFTEKVISVIFAGNIPMVGFHDFITVLVSGSRLRAKLSSDDRFLIPLMYRLLVEIEPEFEGMVEFSDRKMEKIEAIIATGSNNSARYFEYYFGKYPNIIRKNRHGVAVLTGSETEADLHALGGDIFQYFGLGCRSVSKLFVPVNYNFDRFFGAVYSFADDVMHHHKYANNYDYYRAIYMMNKELITENGFLILKEDKSIGSPVAVIFYETYEDEAALRERLGEASENIQCVVTINRTVPNGILPGNTQHPELWDYADGVDTMDFILKLS